MKLTPYGAAQQVTGSCHLVEHDGYRLLLDCGMFQGRDEERNRAPFGFEPEAVDAVVVSHVHLDHIGRLPRLFREGCRAPVYCHPATAALLPLMLQDALGVMVGDYERGLRHGADAPEPWWDERDLERLQQHLVELPYYETAALGPFTVELKNAGHLPGSAFVELAAGGKLAVFSGDLGNQRKEVLADPEFPSRADLVVCEGTYGDRAHRPFQATLAELTEIMHATLKAHAKVLIPSFALERAQEILFHLRDLEERGRIPVAPVFLDSPLAIRVTRAYANLQEVFGMEVRQLFDNGTDPFATAALRCTESVEASKSINDFEGAATIIAGSGMLHGGRILHHLRRHLDDPHSAVIILGFQPPGSLGRALVDGARTVRFFGSDHDVRASVHTIGGFSGHADRDELLEWLEEQPRVALVHGDDEALQTLQQRLAERGQRALVARHGEPIEV
jgi:metallo-beta-lactamase family protein